MGNEARDNIPFHGHRAATDIKIRVRKSSPANIDDFVVGAVPKGFLSICFKRFQCFFGVFIDSFFVQSSFGESIFEIFLRTLVDEDRASLNT